MTVSLCTLACHCYFSISYSFICSDLVTDTFFREQKGTNVCKERIVEMAQTARSTLVRILIYLNTYSGDCEHQSFPALGSAPF